MDRIDLPNVVVDFRSEEVRGPGGAPIELRPQSFAVLRCLAGRAGELVSKDELLTECWPGVAVTEDSLTQCVSEIRRALGESGRSLIRTVTRRGYRLVMPEASAPNGASAHSPHVWAKVAVLPFRALPGDADRAGEASGALATGLAEDIIAELARNRALAVLARDASFAAKAQGLTPAEIGRQFQVGYIIEGTVRTGGARIVVDAQLIDARDSHHAWTERFAFAAEELPAKRDDLAAQIAATVCSEIQRNGFAEILRQPVGTLDARESVLRGLGLQMRRFDRQSVLESRALFEHAVELEPSYGLAHISLGANIASDAGKMITGGIAPDALPDAIATIRRGIELDTTQPYGYHALAYGLFLMGKHEEASKASGQSVALAPGNAYFLAFYAFLRVNAGEYTEGLALAERALAVDPFGPVSYLDCMARALYALGRFELASKHAAEAAERSPASTEAYVTAAAANTALGRREDAAAMIAALLRLSPGYTMQTPSVAKAFGPVPEMRARYVRHLREAGMPE